jgi:hypothetical protein
MLERLDLRHRARAAGIHLLICAAVAALAATLVFGLWYPGAYRLLAGGQSLFVLLISVDVVLGPLLTLAVFNPKKGWPHLRLDLAIIGAVQLAALLYGLHMVYVVRPVAMVFEADRFRVIAAGEVHLPELPMARAEYRALPLSGPWLLGARTPADRDERRSALLLGLEGIDIGQRPRFWQPYAESVADALAKSRPLSVLLAHYPQHAASLRERLGERTVDIGKAHFLPLMARGDWVVILDAAGAPVEYVPVDGFF